MAAESSEGEDEEDVGDHEIGAEQADKLMAAEIQRRERQHYAIDKVMGASNEQDVEDYVKGLENADRPAEELLEGKNTMLVKQVFLPSVSDPSLWFVRCKKGCERQACISLMQKSFVKMQEGQPLLILSVTSLSYLKGYIYIEAFKEAHVRQAVTGLHCIGTKISLVPLKEMADIYTSAKAKKRDVRW